jgi:transcriptional regulator with XRE-family HTH domain
MILLRRVIGDALRARRQSQHRTLREVSTAANVSLGYLSEIERGQKEPSSELLAAICDALGAQLSELLRDVSQTVEVAESLTMPAVPALVGPAPRDPSRDAVPVGATRGADDARRDVAHSVPDPAPAGVSAALAVRPVRRTDVPRDGAKLPVPSAIMVPRTVGPRPEHTLSRDGDVSVSVHQDSPLKATLRTKRNARTQGDRHRDVVCAV